MIILDTNVISELTRPNPNSDVIEWYSHLSPTDSRITAITEAELRYGIALLPPGRRRQLVLSRVETTLQRFRAGYILPFDSHAARSYADIAAVRRAAGKPIDIADGQIAAIVHSVGGELATRNIRDFEGCGINVINPWSAT